ncbi:hypothetical protein [Candidatus Hepatoplasma crinochetorum]|uniref:hypothetical protein n=1 Tax=Candidatus Hepatoplasma crinochetorum TaxID=295596 RepID=UPI00308FE349|nr:MAG: hypothetical protein HCTKY_5320 [Candidatus Hepatoplasma crinochetorum]
MKQKITKDEKKLFNVYLNYAKKDQKNVERFINNFKYFLKEKNTRFIILNKIEFKRKDIDVIVNFISPYWKEEIKCIKWANFAILNNQNIIKEKNYKNNKISDEIWILNITKNKRAKIYIEGLLKELYIEYPNTKREKNIPLKGFLKVNDTNPYIPYFHYNTSKKIIIHSFNKFLKLQETKNWNNWDNSICFDD